MKQQQKYYLNHKQKTKNLPTFMLEIQNTLVSLDLLERHFVCDLARCKGQCCIDGDAGAPITEEEKAKIEEILPHIKEYMTPAGLREVEENGVAYID